MRTPQPPGDAHASRRGGSVPPQLQLIDGLRRGFQAQLQPLLAATLAGAEAELRQQLRDDPDGGEPMIERIANAAVLRTEITRVERRWGERLAEAFHGWPRATTAAERLDTYTLVSEEELQAQLVGQPLVEALERRYSEILETIDSRLQTLAAGIGVHGRPSNPFAPRALIDALRATFPREECDPEVLELLMRRYARLAMDALAAAYATVNAGLADAGLALSSGSELALAGPAPGVAIERGALWNGDNALAPEASSWRRGDGAGAGGEIRQAVRGNALRERARARRPVPAAGDGRRAFSDKEFLSVLALVQGSETPKDPQPLPASISSQLRESLLESASNLGMPPETSAPSAAQDDAIDVVGALFDALRDGHALSPPATSRLARLAYPYVRLAFADPLLFDSADHPAIEVLSELVDAWDAAGEDDAELQQVAAEAADRIANEYHGEDAVFEHARALLHARSEPLRRRAENAERRAAQSMLGRARLRAARMQADRELLSRIDARALLPTVAQFLADQWRQSLVQAWLRQGPDSAEYRDALHVGDAMVQLDDDAARAQGRAVAEGLIAIEQPLRACYVACGLDESSANPLLAVLVGELSRPDAARAVAGFTPMAGDDEAPAATGAAGDGIRLQPGQVVIQQADPLRWLRVAWVSPFDGEHLLVNRHGIRQALWSAAELGEQLAHGEISVRDPGPQVEAAIERLLAADA